MATLLVLGFSSGLPFYLTSKTLQAWMTTAKVDLATIGFFSLVTLPYSLKFVWAPLMDRYTPPFLGRRRGWVLITQVLLLLVIAAMSLHDPRTGLKMLAVNAIAIAFFSASQDISLDAYRTDVLETREMGAGAAVFVMGYRIAMITTGALAFFLADRTSWNNVYLLIALLMIIGIAATFVAAEPVLNDAPPKSLAEAVVLPFADFFQRAGVLRALVVLLFIVAYKYSDSLAGSMTTPFLLQAGFSQSEVGAVFLGVGVIATIAGVVVAGAAIGKIGINRSLWIFVVFQGLSNLTYYGLSLSGKNHGFMVSAVITENFGLGLVTGAMTAYLMSMCNKRFTATQFALLSSLMAASRDILVAPAGKIIEGVGWPGFFLITVAMAIPPLILLPFIAPWSSDVPIGAAPHTGETIPARRPQPPLAVRR
ncbi:MAG: AmpG family muropeptide MFS transporter [Gemmatimonadetes bacterium]|nr:MAG: AmpG family muropeptide MFS transporter [Gemmatimonadota bacterium]PYO78551.1 MAG: AmpG family muropeptide MFS transporter [Gemmatimonadota bacterium]